MAGEVQLNPKQDPIFVPAPASGKPGFIAAIIVADINTLNAIVAGTVPLVCMAFVRSTLQVFLTEDAGANWNAYS